MEQREKKDRAIKIRITESLLSWLQEKAKELGMSVNCYVNFLINMLGKKEEKSYEEKINKYEKREIKSRVPFTVSEATLLREYALSNGWSLSKEIRYRVISSLSRKPKLNKEELETIRAVRASINVLGANINRLVRNSECISNENIEICKNLIELLKELKDKIGYLEKCSYSSFKLKEGKGGGS